MANAADHCTFFQNPPFIHVIKLASFLRRLAVTAGLTCLLAAPAWAANSVSHYGITWYFSSDRPTGTFVNGEPWVVGPVTITNINPNPTQSVHGVQHGSMINPVPAKTFGFDDHPVISRDIVYEASKNVALSFPFNLKVNDVLVSAYSQYEYPTFLRTVCALTVLPSAPPEGSFRPSIFGTDRTVKWNANQINWSVLKNLATVPSTPSRAVIAAQVPPLPWFEWSTSWSGNLLQPRDNTADGNKQYGREIAGKFGQVGLWLNTSQPLADKRDIAIQMIQNGIDIYAYVAHGGGFYHDGGHKCGRKLPLVMAAMMLNDSSLKTMAADPNIFQEDTQTFFVTQSDVGRALDPGAETYRQEDVGMAEWGIRHRWEPNQDNRNWGAIYRAVVGPGMMGPWLAGYLMGSQQTWNHPAAFAYMDRYATVAGAGSPFTQEMYNKHRGGAVIVPPVESALAPVITPAGGSFDVLQKVTISSATSGATIYYTLNGNTPGTNDSVYTGPLTINMNTTVKAIAYKSGINPSSVTTAVFSLGAAGPSFSPAPGSFQESQLVTITSATPGATIHYTVDGSEPTTSSPVYASPVPVTKATTLKAMAVKSGLSPSAATVGVYAVGSITSQTEWTSVAFESRNVTFTYGYDAVPSANNIDTVLGLSGSYPVTDFPQLACAVRFGTSGIIEARNGAAYAAVTQIPYAAGNTYTFRLIVNPATKKYSVTVSTNGGAAVTLAKDYVFRAEQSSLSQLSCMGLISVVGSQTVSSFGIVPDRPQGLRRVTPSN